MQLYMSWHIRSFFGFTFLNILYFFKYSCTNIFHSRSLYTFYHKGAAAFYMVKESKERFFIKKTTHILLNLDQNSLLMKLVNITNMAKMLMLDNKVLRINSMIQRKISISHNPRQGDIQVTLSHNILVVVVFFSLVSVNSIISVNFWAHKHKKLYKSMVLYWCLAPITW